MQSKDPRREYSRESLWSQQTVTTLSSTKSNPEPLLDEEPDTENQVQPLTEPLLQKFNDELKQQQLEKNKRRPKLSLQSGFKFHKLATSAKLSISPSMRDQQKVVKTLVAVIITLVTLLGALAFTLLMLSRYYWNEKIIIAFVGWIFLDLIALLYFVKCFVFKCSRFLYEIDVSEKKGFWFTKTIIFFQNPKLEYSWQSKQFPISDFYCVRAIKAEIPTGNPVTKPSTIKVQKQLEKNSTKNAQDAENVRYIIEVHTAHDQVIRFSVYGSYTEMLEKCKQMTRFVTMMKEVLKIRNEPEIRRRGRIQIDNSNTNETTIKICPPLYLQRFRFIQYLLGGFLLWTCFWIIHLTCDSMISKILMLIILTAAIICKISLCFSNVITKLQIWKKEGNCSSFKVTSYFPIFGFFMIPIYSKKGVSTKFTQIYLSSNNLCFQINEKKSIKLTSLLTRSFVKYLSIFYPFDNVADFQLACDAVNRELNPQQLQMW